MPKLRPIIVLGTRPEAIKLAPLIHECRRRADEVELMVCSTGQHADLLAPMLAHFEIRVDEDLAVMRPRQSQTRLAARCLAGIEGVIRRRRPDCLVAQGDTTTVLGAALAAFYHGLPLVHVEAGLRTGTLASPWPEEFNRRVASLAATLHCAPTQAAADNLIREGVASTAVHVTGNTVIDALLWTREQVRREAVFWETRYTALAGRRVVLVTGHRRENFAGGLLRVCEAIGMLAGQFPGVVFVWPVHLNPQVQATVAGALEGLSNVHPLPPVSYPEFVWWMDRSTLIVTDSGGVQEEAPSLGKPVLVTRESTERPEAIEAGCAELVGTDVERIVERTSRLLSDESARESFRVAQNPYGDGHAAERIVELIFNHFVRPFSGNAPLNTSA